MKNCLKNLLCMLMIVTVVFTLFIPAFASFDTAAEIEIDKAYSDSITSNDGEDFYKFTTTQYGRVRFYFTTPMRPFTLTVYDSNKKEVKKWVTARSTSGDVVYSEAFDAGTYFLKVTGEGILGAIGAGTGSYDFRLTFTPETKGQPETDADKNNDLAAAKDVRSGNTYSGKILNEGENDFYKFTLPSSGTVTVKLTSKMEYYSIYLLNANGNSIWSDDNNQWDASKKQRKDEFKFELSAGTYYLQVNGQGSKGTLIKLPVKSKGNYSFTFSFKTAGQTSVEPNNSIVNPNKISLGKKVSGHLSMTDGADYFEINVAKGSYMIGFVSYMPSYNIRILNADNKEVWSSKGNKLGEKVSSRKDLHEVNLAAGEYFIVVDGGQGKYNFELAKEITVGKPKITSYSRTTTTLKLRWSKVSGASGYEVFKYDEAKKEYVKIGSTTSKRYLTVKKLKSGEIYKFRIRAYKKLNGVVVYGDYGASREALTTPGKASISKVTSTAKKNATVTWKTVANASGYRVFYTTDKDFDYAKSTMVKNSKATSKTVKKLKSGKKYYFKVRAYRTFKSKNIYGALSKVKSVKVK